MFEMGLQARLTSSQVKLDLHNLGLNVGDTMCTLILSFLDLVATITH